MKNNTKFNPGDLVRLNSNESNPIMSVKEWDAILVGFRCQWFAGKKLEQGVFSPESLILVKEDKKTDG